MPEPSQPLRAVRFGAFEADLQSGELRKHGLKLRLQDQPFQILAMLLERRGEMVTREELHQRLWPTDTFVDFDHGLNNAMNRLREALGDSADSPRFVETLPRRGYRFIARVDDGAPPLAHTSPPGDAAPVATDPAAIPAAKPANEFSRAARKGLRLQNWQLIVFALAAGLAIVVALNPGALRQRVLGRSGPARIQSIAVLPLENLTGDPSQEYFVDGMTDALITELAQIHTLRVISRTSAMQYKGTKKSLKEIARDLNVDGIVEGSVVRSGSRVKVTAQLIEAAMDRHVWANSYERDLSDIVTLHDELAGAIAQGIQAKLTPQERKRLASSKPAVNPEAYEAYLKGQYYFLKRTRESVAKALPYFQQAIEKDPEYAPAYAGVSDVYRVRSEYGPETPRRAMSESEAWAKKALELDGTLGRAHGAMAGVRLRYYWDWRGAEAEYRRALELDPNNSQAMWTYALFLRTANRYDEAIVQAKRLRELDPVSVRARDELAGAYLIARKYDQAIEELRQAIAMDPEDASAHSFLATAYEQKREAEKAIAEGQQLVSLSPSDSLSLARLGRTYAIFGKRAEAEKILAELRRRSQKEYVSPFGFALVWMGLGDKEKALAWLERAYQDRSFNLISINSWPYWDPLRSDARFQDLVRRIGLDPEKAMPR